MAPPESVVKQFDGKSRKLLAEEEEAEIVVSPLATATTVARAPSVRKSLIKGTVSVAGNVKVDHPCPSAQPVLPGAFSAQTAYTADSLGGEGSIIYNNNPSERTHVEVVNAYRVTDEGRRRTDEEVQQLIQEAIVRDRMERGGNENQSKQIQPKNQDDPNHEEDTKIPEQPPHKTVEVPAIFNESNPQRRTQMIKLAKNASALLILIILIVVVSVAVSSSSNKKQKLPLVLI